MTLHSQINFQDDFHTCKIKAGIKVSRQLSKFSNKYLIFLAQYDFWGICFKNCFINNMHKDTRIFGYAKAYVLFIAQYYRIYEKYHDAQDMKNTYMITLLILQQCLKK